MYIRTLKKRSANAMSRRGSYTSFGMIGLYNPNAQTVNVISCPEKEDLVGKTFPVEASRGNISNAATYAKSSQTEVRTAIDRMNWAAQAARARDRDASPQILFFFPSVYFSNDKIYVQINPFSCRTPEFEGNVNIRYPVQGFVGVEAFITNFGMNLTSKNNTVYDTVSYFVCRKHAPIHEGFLNDAALGEALASEVVRNPLLDCIKGVYRPADNSGLANENAIESIKYQICVKNHPEIALYGSVCPMYDFESRKLYNTAGDVLERLVNDVCYVLGSRDGNVDAELQEFVRNNVYGRGISGFRLHDALFDMSERNAANTNRRLFAPLAERCSYLLADDPENKDKENANFVCMPPLKRVQSPDGEKLEDKRHLFTLRSLTLLNPDGKTTSYPKGEGLVVIKSRKRKDSEEYYYYLSLEAGFLSHRASDLVTRYSMEGTKIDLSDQGIPTEKILPILREDPEDAARTCQELYAGMMGDVNPVPRDENVSQSNLQEPSPEAIPASEEAMDEVPF